MEGCSFCQNPEQGRIVPEAGNAVGNAVLGSTSEELHHFWEKHDLGSGAADCGCVVMDWNFYPCTAHKRQ